MIISLRSRGESQLHFNYNNLSWGGNIIGQKSTYNTESNELVFDIIKASHMPEDVNLRQDFDEYNRNIDNLSYIELFDEYVVKQLAKVLKQNDAVAIKINGKSIDTFQTTILFKSDSNCNFILSSILDTNPQSKPSKI